MVSCTEPTLTLHLSQKPGNHPNFRGKRSRSEEASLGAPGEFWGILGATLGIQKRILGIQNFILGIQNFILGMASHDLSNTKTTIRSWSNSQSHSLN